MTDRAALRAAIEAVTGELPDALRTPDTTTSRQGPDWITFAPHTLDGPALDRLAAWLAAAHRRAVGPAVG